MLNRKITVSLALAIMILTRGAYSQNLPLSGAINVLSGYGHLAESMKVMPTNISESGINREPIVKVFTIPPAHLAVTADVRTVTLMAHVRTVYCADVDALITEYFHRFDLEGINQTALVFNEHWSPAVIASHFGINEAFVGKGHCYLFLQVILPKTRQRMLFSPQEFDVEELVAKNAENVIPHDPVSTQKFISSVGTHYISSFETGDSLYQVFVMNAGFCHGHGTSQELWIPGAAVFHDKSVHMGKIRAASGNPSVENWAAKNLCSPSKVSESIPNLEILRTNYTLNEQLDRILQDEVILKMELKTLAPVFKRFVTRKWFEKYLQKRLENSAGLLQKDQVLVESLPAVK